MYKLIFLLFLFDFLGVNNALQIVKNPIDQFVLLNSRIMFDCEVDGYDPTTDQVEWCKNDFCTWGRAVEDADGRLRYKSLSRYYLLVDKLEGTWNLMIENVTERDLGQFKCSVTRRNESFVTRVVSRSANLTLMEKPKSIELSRASEFEIILGRDEAVECKVEGGMPAPKIYWMLVDSNFLDKIQLTDLIEQPSRVEFSKSLFLINKTSNFRINTSVLSNWDSSSPVYTNRLSLNGSIDLAGKTLVSIVEHALLDQPVVKSIKIELKYPPQLSISYEPAEPLREGRSYKFYCKAHANPELFHNSSFFHLIDLKKPTENLFSLNIEYIELQVNRSLNGFILRCENKNQVGKSQLDLKFNIQYAPKFLETPKLLILFNSSLPGSSKKEIVLKCRAESNPDPLIFWFKNSNELVHIGESLVLTRDGGKASADGEYTCQAKSAGFDAITARSSIVTTSEPTILGNDLYFSNKLNEITIEFTVLSNPPYKIGPICTKMNQNVSLPFEMVLPIKNSIKYTLDVQDVAKRKISTRFTLKIKEPSKLDNGFYNCTVQNQFGSGNYNFEIRRRDENSNSLLTAMTLSVFFLILIVFLVLLILTLFCIHRRRSLNDSDKKVLPSVSDISSNYNKNVIDYSGAKNLIVNDLLFHDKTMNEIVVKNLPGFDHISSSPNNCIIHQFNNNSFISKQLNHISLIEQNFESNSFSFESLPNSSDTQNLIFADNLKLSLPLPLPPSTPAPAIHLSSHIVSDRSHSSTSSKMYPTANIYSSRFQTNV